ncbi:condensation domain-containing protein [Nocardia terpenica]|uniref:NAD-dependent epimerase/dehydratase family protein n=1 Tax=Nocardia terpenica TaxID=455432 RepID=A0A6G9Z4W9_9NOCA|nr:condensation domain-containing protein [Nocardia terpenica]QIS20397.1 NAD-dependent epimerase/dehydratase family protein [Nocardia terpenica]
MTTATHREQEELLRLARAQARKRAGRSVSPGRTAGPAPLSHAQRRMWLMDKLGQGGVGYHVPFATRVRGALDVAALERALAALVHRHDVLRTRYGQADGGPYQEVMAPQPVPVAVVDAIGDGRQQLEEEAARPFDLTAGPVLRALVVRHSAEDHTVLLTLHHIAVDGGSLGLLAEQLGELYGRVLEGRSLTSKSGPSYAEFARREQGRDDSGLTHWVERLADARPVPLPRPNRSGYRRGDGHTLAAPLPSGVSDGLRRTGQAYGATVFTVVLAAAFAALHEITGADDMIIGCASGHRERGLVGLCVNTLPIRVQWADERDAAALLPRVRATLLDAQRHRDTPFDLIVERLGEAGRDRNGNSLVDVSVDVLGDPPALRLPGCRAEPVDIDLGAAKFGLALCLEETIGNTPRCVLRYDRTRLDERTAQRLLHSFADLVRGMAADAALPLPLPRVEALLRDRPEIADAVVLPRDGARPLAYVVPSGTGSLATDRLLTVLRTKLEPAAVPLAVTVLDALPRSSDGTVDRSRLPGAADEPAAPVHPLSERARLVVAAFGEVLGEIPDPDGDFIALGGQSLMAVRLAENLRTRLRLPLTGLDILEHRTPRALAALLDERSRQREHATPTLRRSGTRPGTVLVTGATGGVGAFVVRELAARGRPVRALARPESAHLVDGAGVEVVEGDLTDPDSLRAAVSGAEAVIHAACTFTAHDVDRAAMRALLDGWRHGPFVFVSSIDAYGRPSGTSVAEGTAAEKPLSPYGRAKLDCEQMLWATAADGRGAASAVRAPIVWGSHPRLRDQLRWGATGSLFQAIQRGEPVPLPDDDAWYGTPWVHAAALARAIVACAERPVRGVVNAIGGHVGWMEFATELTRLLNTGSELVRAPGATLPDLRHAPHFESPTLATELTEQPGEDWRTTIAAMITDR